MRVNLISETTRTVQGHGVHSAFVDMRESLSRQESVELLVNSREKSEITHVHTTGPFSLLKAIKAKKCVISAHLVPDSLKGSLKFTRIWLPLYTWYLTLFYNQADLLLANSPYTFSELKKLRLKTRLEFLPLGVNRQWFKKDFEAGRGLRKEYGFQPSDFIVISVGQIQPRKDVKTFIEVAKKLPEITFIWVGGRPFGRLTEGYEEMDELMKNPPKNVRFIGEVSYEKMAKIYSMANIFFMPSLQETYGLVITEAASVGLPVVLRDLEIYTKLFHPHYQSSDSVDGFVEIIEKLSKDPQALKAQQVVSEQLAEKYDIDTIATRLVEYYSELIQL